MQHTQNTSYNAWQLHQPYCERTPVQVRSRTAITAVAR